MPDKLQHYRDIFAEINKLRDQGKEKEAIDRCLLAQIEAEYVGDEGFVLFFSSEEQCIRGNLRQGEEFARQAVEKLPDIHFCLTNYAIILSMRGLVRPALRMLDKALALNNEDILAWSQKGVCLAKIRQETEAIPCFDKVLSLDPQNTHALRNKGVSLLRIGKPHEAIKLFDRVLELSPQDRHARWEKKVLQDELSLKGTPLGWLFLWIRKVLVPAFKRWTNQSD